MPVDPAALGELVRRHGAGLALYARRFCLAPDDAAQSALARLALLAVAPDDPPAWLFAACRREALQIARSERRRRTRECRAAAAWFAPAPDSAVDPEAVQAAVTGLPAEFGEAVTLHLWGDLSFAQVGAVLGVSAATAHRRYCHALELLRDRLGTADDARPAGNRAAPARTDRGTGA